LVKFVAVSQLVYWKTWKTNTVRCVYSIIEHDYFA